MKCPENAQQRLAEHCCFSGELQRRLVYPHIGNPSHPAHDDIWCSLLPGGCTHGLALGKDGEYSFRLGEKNGSAKRA